MVAAAVHTFPSEVVEANMMRESSDKVDVRAFEGAQQQEPAQGQRLLVSFSVLAPQRIGTVIGTLDCANQTRFRNHC